MSEEKKTIRVRIQSDDKPYSLIVTDVETGKVIDNVFKVQWTADAGYMDRFPTAEIVAYVPVVDVIADAELRHVCPACGRSVEEQQDDVDLVQHRIAEMKQVHLTTSSIEALAKSVSGEMARQLRAQGRASRPTSSHTSTTAHSGLTLPEWTQESEREA